MNREPSRPAVSYRTPRELEMKNASYRRFEMLERIERIIRIFILPLAGIAFLSSSVLAEQRLTDR